MELTPQEQKLIGVVRTLPPQEAGKVLLWAHQLSELGAGSPIQWSDSWSDEDLADATASALHRFEREEKEDR